LQKLGILDNYRCGVMFRIECWLENLGITYEMNPKIDTCIMSANHGCPGSIRVNFLGGGKNFPY